MGSRFTTPVRDQSFLEVVSYRDMLGEDHLVWTVINVVEGLDLSELYARYCPDDGIGGRPAFDPAMMVSLLLFGYCEGKRSSRQLEDACIRDWAYRAICGDLAPDHATIARFRVKMDDLLDDLFAQVLMVCVEAGMVDVSVVAVDGTRMASVASIEANRTGKTLAEMKVKARAMLDEAAQADDLDPDPDADPDPDRGVVPAREPGRRSSVSRRSTEQVRRVARIDEADRVVSEGEARRAVDETKRNKPVNPVGNVTDPESRLQKTRGGFIQGYNAQAVVSGDQVVIACDVTNDPTDQAQLKPMLEAATTNVALAGITDRIGFGLADAGYASCANFATETDLGMCLLIATSRTSKVGKRNVSESDKARDDERIDLFNRVNAGEYTTAQAAGILGLSPGWTARLYRRYQDHGDLASSSMLAWQAMTQRLAKPKNRDLYRQRGWLIEGSFAHTKTNRGLNSFTRHSLTACQAEWNLINIAGNLNKLHNRRLQTPPTQPTDRTQPLNRRTRPHQTAPTRPVPHQQPPTPKKAQHNCCTR
jgi:transposase